MPTTCTVTVTHTAVEATLAHSCCNQHQCDRSTDCATYIIHSWWWRL